MKRHHRIPTSISALLLSLSTLTEQALAQPKGVSVDTSVGSLPYILPVIALAALGVAYFFWKKSKKKIVQAYQDSDNRTGSYFSNPSFEMNDVDAEKELEWLRKATKPGAKTSRTKKAKPAESSDFVGTPNSLEADTRVFQEKMKMLQYAQLPINSFSDLTPAKQFEPLPEANAKALQEAIQQSNEEFEPDESIRDLAIKTLASFRTAGSAEALSQVALYDLSSALRSKAVTVLTDFDHESVFETILLACADPTREVRAAAARGLFRLNFDRSGAWKRIIETHDEFRMSQAVRAAVEAEIVTKSLDRLVHEDIKIAYEAFTLVALIIKAGESKVIFDAIVNHKDERVKFALLHILKVIKDERSLEGLKDLNGSCSAAVNEKVQDILKGLGVTAKSAG